MISGVISVKSPFRGWAGKDIVPNEGIVIPLAQEGLMGFFLGFLGVMLILVGILIETLYLTSRTRR